jgi:hypothetical protein
LLIVISFFSFWLRERAPMRVIRTYPGQFVPQFGSLSFREIVSLTFAEQREERAGLKSAVQKGRVALDPR